MVRLWWIWYVLWLFWKAALATHCPPSDPRKSLREEAAESHGLSNSGENPTKLVRRAHRSDSGWFAVDVTPKPKPLPWTWLKNKFRPPPIKEESPPRRDEPPPTTHVKLRDWAQEPSPSRKRLLGLKSGKLFPTTLEREALGRSGAVARLGQYSSTPNRVERQRKSGTWTEPQSPKTPERRYCPVRDHLLSQQSSPQRFVRPPLSPQSLNRDKQAQYDREKEYFRSASMRIRPSHGSDFGRSKTLTIASVPNTPLKVLPKGRFTQTAPNTPLKAPRRGQFHQSTKSAPSVNSDAPLGQFNTPLPRSSYSFRSRRRDTSENDLVGTRNLSPYMKLPIDIFC